MAYGTQLLSLKLKRKATFFSLYVFVMGPLTRAACYLVLHFQ